MNVHKAETQPELILPSRIFFWGGGGGGGDLTDDLLYMCVYAPLAMRIL